MRIERIGVAGAGTMGAGIAQLTCLGGYETRIHDPDPEALRRAGDRVRGALDEGATRGRWSRAEAEAAAARLRPAAELAGLGECGLVIEAAPEDLELKRELIRALADECGPDTVLATNTSSLRVDAIAAAVERPERVCGMHFFNPPDRMELVEVVAGERTSEETVEAAFDVAESCGRRPIRTGDGIGFIVNRCARPFTLEAVRLVGERIAPPATIDRIARLGGGFRMGPFEVMDLIGIDVALEVSESFFSQTAEPRWRPHPLQARLVADGRLGRKSGWGFYRYGEQPHRPADPDPPEVDPEVEPPPDAISPTLLTPGGTTAHPLESRGVDALGDDGHAVGYVALPNLAEARLVELARGPQTTDAAAADAEAHFRGLGKHVEWVGTAPGLVLGRILAQLVNEACHAASEGVGSPDDIDAAVRLGLNHPRGPFEWGEAIGPGRVLAILEALRWELADERFAPASLLGRWAADRAAA